MASGPLASLYENNGSTGNLIYPKTLGSSRTGHWITFQISVPTASSFLKQQLVVNSVNPAADFPLQGAAVTGDNLIATLNSDSVGVVSNIPTGDKIEQDFWQYTVSPGTTKLVDVISLYTPDTVSISQQAYYSEFSLTEAGGVAGFIAEAAAGFASAENLNNSEVGKQLKSLASEALTKGLTNNQNLANAALKMQGKAVNPMMEVLFTSIGYREYQFDFLFSPKSQDEAATVREIIKKFKFHSAPEVDFSGAGGGRYFIVPSVFNIEFYFNGKPNTNVHKIGLSALQTVFVDYAPQGWVTHDDGMPVQTRLTLKFKETEIMTKQKIEQGY